MPVACNSIFSLAYLLVSVANQHALGFSATTHWEC